MSTAQLISTWIIVIIYAVVILYFVVRGALKTQSISDYTTGSLQFSPVFVGLSLAASMTSAATFVINPGLIANFGVSALLSYGVFFPLASLISLYVLSKSFRKFGVASKAQTLASWIGERYQSKGYALFIAVMSLLLLTFIVLILVAVTKVLANALNTNEIFTLLVVVIFVFGYMMFGGANSLVYTNTIQSIIMVIVAVLLIFSGYQYFKDGLPAFFEKLHQIDPSLTTSVNSNSPLFRGFFEIMFAQIVVGAAVVCQPHIITKSLLLKKDSDLSKFLLTAILIQGLFYSVVIAGLYARLTFPDLTYQGKSLGVDGIISAYVVKVFSQGWLSITVGIIIVLGLISAGLSTIEGLIQSLSSTITNNIIKPLFGKSITHEKSYLTINKLVIIGMAIAAFILSMNQLINPKVSVAIFAQNGVYSFFSIAFVPILFGIFSKSISKNAVITGSLTALIVYILVYYILPISVSNGTVNLGNYNLYFTGKVQNPAIASALAIIVSVIVTFLSENIFKTKKNV